ncbi:MAG: aminopeptidase P family N-terminal domain-containing protein, partial [Acidobacteria bacterium Pan2503]|nr:aminopeptidase P family N-terminal domain-containing protein [Candidatus Acidoferrum panamensis]
MSYPVDEKKWPRVREMLERHDLDALVVRAPDNILYLTNYWTMKGYDLVIFPRDGDPTLLVIEPQFREAERTAWNKDVRFFRFYDAKDPRPPMVRAVEMAVDVLGERKLDARVGIELSQFSQICDRMVGEPTVYWQGYYDAFRSRCREVIDAAPLLADVDAIGE